MRAQAKVYTLGLSCNSYTAVVKSGFRVGAFPDSYPPVAVPGRVGEVRVAADEPEAVDLDPGVLARRLDTVPYSLDLFYPGIQVTESPPRMVTC